METKRIGNKIAEARKKVVISQAQLAKRLFISPQAVGKWERGESMPDIITLNRLAEILGVDLNYFSDNFRSLAPVPFGASDKQTDGEDLSTALPQAKGTKPELKSEEKLSWNMSRGNWANADFSGLSNLHEKFSSSNMQHCKFVGSDLSELLLKSNNVEYCDFSGSNFSNSSIQKSHIAHNLFRNCALNNARFEESYVLGCDFAGADFTGVVFKSGGFSGVPTKKGMAPTNTIIGAVWKRTSFVDAYMADLVIEGTINDCSFENCSFKKVLFRNATFLNTFFKNKTLKGIKFVNCRADKMTYEFLKNGKADLTGITLTTIVAE